MFRKTLFCARPNLLYIIKRHKFYRKYWAPVKKKTLSTEFALKHFDEFYGSIYGENQWNSIRQAILRNNHYVALVNNFSEDTMTIKFLESIGAHDVKRLFEAQKEINEYSKPYSYSSSNEQTDVIKGFADQITSSKITEQYTSDNTEKEQESIKTTNEQASFNTSLSSNLEQAEYDESRVITAEMGMQATNLWTFVPATRLKGCDDWIPESQHYQYYSKADDFPLSIEEEDDLEWPEHLKVFAFEKGANCKFHGPRLGPTDVLDYYLMDGASILPVLALGLEKGDRVLDMCAAPGGKSLAILQTMHTSFLVSNDSSKSRTKRIHTVFCEYLHDYKKTNTWDNRVFVSTKDGRFMNDAEGFNKILIDAPCTTDRHSLKENDSNIFGSLRVKERLKIPELQCDLLSKALQLCKVGGTVVYSTCTLSPIQNDGVVHMSLKKAWEEYGVSATIKNVTKAFEPARSLFRIARGHSAPKYGQLILPDIYSNFGPAYFAKLVKTKG